MLPFVVDSNFAVFAAFFSHLSMRSITEVIEIISLFSCFVDCCRLYFIYPVKRAAKIRKAFASSSSRERVGDVIDTSSSFSRGFAGL